MVLEELEDEPFVMLGSEFSTHQDIKAACHRAGFEPKVVLLSSQWDFVVQMVRRNFGVAFLPLSLFRRFSFPDIRLLRVENAISVDRLELITKHDCYVSRNVNCFVSFIVQEMEKNPFLDRIPGIRHWPNKQKKADRSAGTGRPFLFCFPPQRLTMWMARCWMLRAASRMASVTVG